MSTLTMAPSLHPGLRSDYAWDSNRSSAYTPPPSDPKSIALPSIRQVGASGLGHPAVKLLTC